MDRAAPFRVPPGLPVIEFTVSDTLAGQRPDRALRACAPGLDRALALKLLREGRILVNGKAATLRTTLAKGDVVRAKAGERRAQPKAHKLRGSTPTPEGFGLVYLDEHLCIADKPGGMPTHPGTGVAPSESLTWRVKAHLARTGRPPEVAPAAAGRLDRGTSGLVVLSLSRAAETALGKAFQGGDIVKQYLALCRGVTQERFDVDVPLVVSRYSGGDKHKKLKDARTRFERLAAGPSASLVRAFPETGRTHQIRRHLKHAGHPVVGDSRYGLPGRGDNDADGLCLHMHHLELAHPATGLLLDVEVDPPEAFQQALAAAGLPPRAWLSGRRAP